jgi:rod shape-determining protein MreC
VLLAGLAAFSLLLIVAPDGATNWIRASAAEILGPAQSAGRPALRRGTSVLGHWLGAWDLAAENEALRRRVAALRSRLSRARGSTRRLEGEIKRLSKTARTAGEGPYALVRGETTGILPTEARIVAADASNWRRAFFINRGGSDGVRAGDYVAVGDAVVGMVARTAPHYSAVLAANDPSFRIAVYVPRTAEEGVLKGTLSGECKFDFRVGQGDMREGDTIQSSGYGGRCPKGFVLGVVTGALPGRGGRRKAFRVRPVAAWQGLDTVVVLTRREEP